MGSNTRIGLCAAALIGLVTALPATSRADFFRPPPPEMMSFGPPPIMHLIHQLDLSTAQRDQAFAILDRYQPTLRKLMFGLEDARDSLRGILRDGGFDPGRVAQEAATQGQAVQSLYATVAKMLSEISAILTPAQRARIDELGERDPPMSFRGP